MDHPAGLAVDTVLETVPDAPPEGERWSTWETASHGPTPRPEWVVTDAAAVDLDLGVLKSGKEADVHVLRRWVPGAPGRECVMAAKRYRPSERRLFHRDAGYTEGRRVRRSREMRAMARRTEFGRELLSGQWAAAEFEALKQLWSAGFPVPYPVQLDGTEMLMELVGDQATATAAHRLHAARPTEGELASYTVQVRDLLVGLADAGWAHGDLSPYNVLVDGERLVVIDWPQIVDVIGNPQGFAFLERDVLTMGRWLVGRGADLDVDLLLADVMAAATQGW